MNININGTTYELATTLRVAYKIQGQHNHKAYTEIFEKIGEMPVEQQIGMLYAAFQCANPTESNTITQVMFTDYYLDNFTLKDLMEHLKELVTGITGEDIDKLHEQVATDIAKESQGN